jgi:hypothetical protein
MPQLAVEADSGRVQVALLAKAHPRSVAAALDALARVAEQARLLAVRERAHELRPTWTVCLEKRDRLLENPNARWLDLEREDVAQLLALQGLLADACSRDVTDDAGRPLEAETVRQWAQAELDVGDWAPMRALREAASSSRSAQSVAPQQRQEGPSTLPSAPDSDSGSAVPGVATAQPTAASAVQMNAGSIGPALGLLVQLRVASLDRLVREVARVHGPCTRTSVCAELERARARVQWFGRSIVAIKEDP